MKMDSGFYFILFLLFLKSINVFSQGDKCTTLEPFCAGDEELVFENSNYLNSSQDNGEVRPDYGCLLSQPYPAWFFLQIEEGGSLQFVISQFKNDDGSGLELDVDFVVWGPFKDSDDYCSDESLSEPNIIDCSYERDAQERMSIPNAQADEIYVVLITNYSQSPGYISLQQTNTNNENAGSTDCTILESTLGGNQNICGEDEYILDGTTEDATLYEWYVYNQNTDEYNPIPGENGPTLKIINSGNYKLVVTDEINDITAQDNVDILFYDIPQANNPQDLIICRETLEDEDIFFDLTKTEAEILAGNTENENLQVFFYESVAGMEEGDFIENPTVYEGEEDQPIFAHVVGEESGCISETVNFSLEIGNMPEIEIAENTVLCLDLDGQLLNEVAIGEDLGNNYSYEWISDFGVISTNPVLVLTEVPEASSISFKVTSNKTGCDWYYETNIQTFSAPQEISIEIEGSDFRGGYIITAAANGGIGETEYEYRLDNGNWQESEVFRNVPPGEHGITAREIHGCGQTTSERFKLFGYPRFFTPNSDGHNDTWNVINDKDASIQTIYIFDRYGKFLKQLEPGQRGWDGTYKNRDLPSDDYWFKLEYLDPETGKIEIFSGNFTLKR